GSDALALVAAALKADDPYSLAFVDIRMPPGWDGVETIARLWKISPDLQAVICTAYSDYSWHDIIGRFGHTDNLLILKKPFETVEVLQLTHALSRKWSLGRQARLKMGELEKMAQERAEELVKEIAERARAQSALLASEEKFSKAFQSSPMAMAIQSRADGRFLAVNPSFVALTGYSLNQITQHSADELRLWKDAPALAAVLEPEGRLRGHSCQLLRQDGEERGIVLCSEPLTAEARPCLLMVAEDVTEKLKLEAGLRQAQKLEVVGRLVAGVAHEFNNVLGVIQGHASLLQSQLARDKRPTACTERILQASARAANYTKQLLGITRQQTMVLKAVDLSNSIQRARQLLEQSLGDDYRLVVSLDEKLPAVCADECNLEQVLINLVLNARDAMAGGGD
ncbi:MAG: PAS domain S-box protein, partial [Limisphaerales bacterium]